MHDNGLVRRHRAFEMREKERCYLPLAAALEALRGFFVPSPFCC